MYNVREPERLQSGKGQGGGIKRSRRFGASPLGVLIVRSSWSLLSFWSFWSFLSLQSCSGHVSISDAGC